MPRPSLSHLSFLLIALLVCVALPAFAVPPAVPSDVSVFLTKSSPANTYVFFWTDNSSDEEGFEIRYRFGTTGSFEALATTAANTSAIALGLTQLPVGTKIQFTVRAFKETPKVWSAESTVTEAATIIVPATVFTAPTNVTLTPQSESIIRVAWNNPSTSEDGVELWMAEQPGGAFSYLGDVQFYRTSQIDITALVSSVGYQFNLRSYKEPTTAGGARVYSAFSSSPVVFPGPPTAPTSLTVSNVGARNVNLTWVDNSQLETSYEILVRPAGSGQFKVHQVTPNNPTMPVFVRKLPPGVSLDFAVRARAEYTDTPSVSANSNVVTQLMKDGINSSHYAQVYVGQPLSYQMTTTTGAALSTREITDLPAGLTFDSNSGLVTGTLTVAGVTTAKMKATFTGGAEDTQRLAIRVLNPPVLGTTIPAQNLSTGMPQSIPLSSAFTDPDAPSAVKVVTSLGTMDFILFNTATPLTVANFMSYVNAGAYFNNLFHRSVPDFVVQGGAFRAAEAPFFFTSAPTLPAVPNEPGLSNIRGTISMAKISAQPDSATNQFFINVENNGLNTENNGANLDVDNGGFTVFGRVAGSGMSVADAIAALPTGDYGLVLDGASTAFNEWPLNSPDALSFMDNTKVVTISSITPTGVFKYVVTGNTNPGAVTATISEGNLVLTPVAPGTSSVSVQATNLDGVTLSQTVAVTTISGDASLSGLTLSAGSLSPALSSSVTSYNVAVNNATSNLIVTPAMAQSQGTVKVNGVTVPPGSASAPIALTAGNNVITIVGTAPDGFTTKTYTVNVTRAAAKATGTTLDATAINPTGATLNGSVIANGTSSTITFQYGTTTSYGGTINATPSPVTGDNATPVSAALTGLSPGTLYHYRLKGTNSAGTSSGTDKTFTTASAVATLSSLKVSTGALSPAFASANTSYAVAVPNATTSITVTPTLAQSQSEVEVNGVALPSGTASGAIVLAPGTTVVSVLVTAQDGVTTKNYTLAVTRAQPPAATTLGATGIGATSATLQGSVNGGGAPTTVTFEYGLTASYGSSAAASPGSVTGSTNTPVGAALNSLQPATTYHFRVKAANLAGTTTGADGTFTTPSNVATLSGLVLSTGALSPAFASGTTSYKQSVPNVTSSLIVTPTASNANATVTVNTVVVPSGNASGAIGLSPGLNTITVQVTAQDGVTVKTYTIGVTRPAPPLAVTQPATNVTPTGAKLHATVDALNASTTASFVYGLTTSYGSTAAASPSPVTDSGVTPVSATLSGLQPATTYHYQAKGVSSVGTGLGADMMFTTPDNLATLSSLTLSAGTLSPAFASATATYTATVSNATNTLTVTPVLTANTATVTVNGTPVASGSPSAPIPLNIGSNVITIVGTAQDGSTTKTYKVTVTRTSMKPTVATAAPSNVTLNGGTLNGTVNANNMSTTVAFDYGPTAQYGKSATATPSTVTGAATTGVSAALAALAPGTTYHYRVRGTNGAGTGMSGDATFTTTSNVATLSGLVLSSGGLSPAFAGGTTSYTQIVPVGTTSLTVKPTATNANAAILLNNVPINSGATSGPMALNPGPNVITVKVTAQDGVTIKTYTITVTRSTLPAATTLAAGNLKTNGAKLNGTVNAEGLSTGVVFEYGLTASYGQSVAATPASASGAANIPVSATLANLSPGKTYHFRVKGTNSAGIGMGSDATFLTQSANLSSMVLSGGTLTPAFATDTTTYTANVPYAVPSLTVTPTVTDSATVKVNGTVVNSGNASNPIALAVGANVINVALTSQDGLVTKTYTVTVTRADSVPGLLDVQFNGTGKVTTSMGGTQSGGGNDIANAVAVQTDGKIVAVGTSNDNGLPLFAVVRYNPDGSLDTTFNGTGKVTTDFVGSYNFAYGVAIQSDGKIVVVGEASGGVALARYQANGTLDPTFNATGKVLINDTELKSGRGVVLQSDGKIVVAVERVDGTNHHWLALLRCHTNGIPDTTFGGGGTGKIVVPTSLSEGFDSYSRSVTLQPDGKILLAGYGVVNSSGQGEDFEITRFNANGTWDLTFGGGVVSTDFGAADDRGLGVVLQSDGKILVGGSSSGNFALARYNTNGTPDATFNGTGKATADFGGAHDAAAGIAIQGNGKILLGGFTDNGGNYDFALARFTTGGILDTGFNGTGRVITPIGAGADFANAIVWQLDGKILLAGQSFNGSDSDFALTRYEGDTGFAALTLAATGVTATGATLNGLVAPNALSTSISFDHGLTTSYGSNVAATPPTVAGDQAVSVSKILTGLVPDTTYHFRIRGVNSSGTALGADGTFTTPNNVATLSGLVLSSGALSPAFAGGTLNYTQSLTNATSSLTVTPTASDPSATVTVNSVVVPSGSATSAITLTPGLNTIVVQVTAQDGTTSKTYTIAVTQKGTPVAVTQSATNVTPTGAKLNATVNALNTSTTASFVYGLTTSYGSTAKASPFPVIGSSPTPVSVTLSGLNPATTYHYQAKGVSFAGTGLGADMTFTTPNNVATLGFLSLSSGVLSPAFASAKFSYTSIIGNGASSVRVTPFVTSGSAATVKVNGVTVASGAASGAIPLNIGPNTITVDVTAQDGVTKKTYTIVATRSAAVASLSTRPATGITPTAATLNGTVNTANSSSTAVTFEYGLTTNYGTSITAVPTTVNGIFSTYVSKGITGLKPGTTYHYRVKGVNAGGTSTSPDQTFTTISTSASLSGLTLTGGTLSPVFSSATTSYTSHVPAATASLTVTPVVAGTTSTVSVNDVAASSGAPSGSISLSPGLNIISVRVTAQDGVTTNTYTVAVTRLAAPAATTLAPDNVTAVGAKLQGAMDAQNTSTTTTFFYGLTAAYGSNITATPSPVTGDGATPVSAMLTNLVPNTTYHYQVKGVSTGGTSLGTDVAFTTPNNVANLSGLALSAGTLSPAFASGTTSYTATVGNASNSITVTPTLGSGDATVTVNSVTVISGNASGAIPLNVGTNVITIVGTAEDGTTTKTYTVTVTRQGLAPAATTVAATSLNATGATLNGLVNANNTATTVSFDYGLTAAYGSNVAATPQSLTGNAGAPVSAVLGNLSPSTTYHFRVRGVNSAGTTMGADMTFTTPSNVATLSGLVLSTGALSPAFTSATTNYSRTELSATESVTVSPTSTSASETLLLNGAPITSGSTSAPISLSPGLNTITVQATAEDGATTITYTVSVTRTATAPIAVTQNVTGAVGTGATLHGSVNAQGTSTNATFDYGLTTAYGSSVVALESPLSGSGSVPVSAVLSGLLPGATYHYRANAQNPGGVSTGQDATFTTPSSDATLAGLTLSTGALTPAFVSATTDYTQTVPNATTSLTVTPAQTHPAATMLLNGATILSGVTSGPIALAPGPNTITLQVTAQDGTTTKTYTLVVTRTTPPPTALTQAADDPTGTTGATVHGTVNAQNTPTTVTFEYGLTTAYGSSANAAESPVNGNSATPVSAVLSGLQSFQTYHYRVKAVNVGGAANGSDATFMTAHLEVLAEVTPTATTSTSATPVVLHATGLAPGETVLVERFVDSNTNGVVDAGDLLAEMFNITDGQVTSINGVRNTNVPGDEDGSADGQISVNLIPFFGSEIGRLAGPHIIRVSSPGAVFSPATTTLTVTNPAQGQAISGTITDGTNPVPYAGVVLLDTSNDGEFAFGAVANASGQFTLAAPAGSYDILAVKPGFVAGFDPVVLTAGNPLPHNLLLAAATSSISGKVADAVTQNGLGGVQLFAQSQSGLAALASSQADGTYSIPVTAAQWQIDPADHSLRLLGYLSLSNATDGAANTTSAPQTGVNLNRSKVTALIHGTVADSGATPLAGIRLGANDANHTYTSDVWTDTSGHYVLGALAGSWEAFVAQNSPGLAGYVVPDGKSVSPAAAQAVQANFTLLSATAQIAGDVKDLGNQPVVGVHVTGTATSGGVGYTATSVTDANGHYSLPVFAGTWNVSVSSEDLSAQGYLSPGDQDAVVTTGTVTINFTAPLSTTTITGSVKDSQNNPIVGVPLSGSVTISGVPYESSAITDASGNYSMPVVSGDWTVGVSSDELLALGFVPPPEQQATISGPAILNFIAPHATGAIAGTVKDLQNSPITGVQVFAEATLGAVNYSLVAITDSGGGYSLPAFAGTWNVGVSSSDLNAQGCLSPPDQSAAVTTGTVTRNFVAPHTTATIEGDLKSTQFVNIGNVHIYAVATVGGVTYSTSTITNGSGHYSLPVCPGSWTVSVSTEELQALGYLGIAAQGAVVNGGTFTLNFSAPHTNATIHGSVKTPSNTPAPFVQVIAYELGQSGYVASTQTDASGNYTLGVITGKWDVAAGEMPGFVPEHQDVTVPSPASDVLQDLIIHPVTAHLRGQVRDNQNNPVPNLAITAHDSGLISTNVNGTSDASGNFDLAVFGGEGVTATKQWTLQVLLGGGPVNYVSSNDSFFVTDGVDINGITYHVFIVTAHLRGQVIDAETGNPIPNIAVYASGQNASSGSEVNAFGSFDIPVLGGNWSLGVSNAPGLISQVFPVSVTDGIDQNGLELHARHTTANAIIAGSVMDAQNHPVIGVQVFGNATLSGTDYATFTVTDAAGNFSMPVFSMPSPASWSVGVSASDLGLQGYAAPSNKSAEVVGAGTVNLDAFSVGLSSNADLANLALSSGTLNAPFESSTQSYSATVSNATTSLSVTPALSSLYATVTVQGNPVTSGSPSNPINLNVGANPITVVGTAQNGTSTKTYTITVTRQGP